jgi:ribosomal protein S27AE
MHSENFKDPRCEYKRICPYCLEPFTAMHMNRFYCPEKNGIKNFCKHRQKRLIKALKESGIELERPNRPPLKFLFEPSVKDSRNIDEGIKETLLSRNIKLLYELLDGAKKKIVNQEQLENIGFEFESFEKMETNLYGTKSPIYGEIKLTWLSDGKVEIINLI